MKNFQLMDKITSAIAVVDKHMNIAYSNAAYNRRNNIGNLNPVGSKCFSGAYKLNQPCSYKSTGVCPVTESFKTKKSSSTVHHFWVEDHAMVEVINTSPIIEDNGDVNYVIEEFNDMTPLLGLKKGIISTCSYCHKIHDDDDQWVTFDKYIHRHTGADFSHGVCEECSDSLLKELENNKINSA